MALSQTSLPKEPFRLALLIGLFHKFENPEIIMAKHLSTWLKVDGCKTVDVAVLLSLQQLYQ